MYLGFALTLATAGCGGFDGTVEPPAEARTKAIDLSASKDTVVPGGTIRVRRHTYRRVDVRNEPTVVPLELVAGLAEGATPALAYNVLLGYGQRDMRRNLRAATERHAPVDIHAKSERTTRWRGPRTANSGAIGSVSAVAAAVSQLRGGGAFVHAVVGGRPHAQGGICKGARQERDRAAELDTESASCARRRIALHRVGSAASVSKQRVRLAVQDGERKRIGYVRGWIVDWHRGGYLVPERWREPQIGERATGAGVRGVH